MAFSIKRVGILLGGCIAVSIAVVYSPIAFKSFSNSTVDQCEKGIIEIVDQYAKSINYMAYGQPYYEDVVKLNDKASSFEGAYIHFTGLSYTEEQKDFNLRTSFLCAFDDGLFVSFDNPSLGHTVDYSKKMGLVVRNLPGYSKQN